MIITATNGAARGGSRGRRGRWVATLLAAATLGGGALGSVPAAADEARPTAPAAAQAEAESPRPPQKNVPVLEPGGPAQAVIFPPDKRHRDHASGIEIQAPPHTRITQVGMSCHGMNCPVDIADDGRSATVKWNSTNWTNDRPTEVHLAADADAPAQGGTFHGSFTYDGQKQDLRVRINARAVVQVEGVTAVPGENAVPKVIVTNTTDQRIGRRDVTLALGPGGLKWLGWRSVYTPRNGGREEFKCQPVPSDRDKTLCKDVGLNLDPGESIELRTIVGTYSSLKPCEVPRVNFAVDGLGAGDANFVMKDENGDPPTCPNPA